MSQRLSSTAKLIAPVWKTHSFPPAERGDYSIFRGLRRPRPTVGARGAGLDGGTAERASCHRM